MPLLGVLTFVALRVAAAVSGFGWAAAPFRPALPAPAPDFTVPAPPQEPAPLLPQAQVPVPMVPMPMPVPLSVGTIRPIGLVVTHEPTVAITFDACATRSHRYGFDW